MHFNEKISSRLKRVYIGIAMGIAIWLLYTSYLVLSNAISTNNSLGAVELVLTPITSIQR
jgi:predicted small secreted protein